MAPAAAPVAFAAMSDPDFDLPEPEDVLTEHDPVPDDEREVAFDDPEDLGLPVDDDDFEDDED